MKSTIFYVLTILVGTQGYAASFESSFPNFKSGIDKCPATSILSNASERGGVSPIRGDGVDAVYDCSDLGSDLPLDSKIKIEGELRMVDGKLQTACAQGKKVLCYASNTGNGVCVVNPREQSQTTVYGDVGTRTEHFPRFDYIVSFSRGISKYQKSTAWEMDAAGCKSTGAQGHTPSTFAGSSGSGPISRQDCVEEMTNFMTGGLLYPSLNTPEYKARHPEQNAPKDRYGDGVSKITMWNRLDELANCKLAYPDLIKELEVKK